MRSALARAPGPAYGRAMPPRALILALPLLMAACASLPEVERAERPYADAPAPDLLPTDQLLAMEGTPLATEALRIALLARADALRTRADAIRRRPSG